MLVKRTALHDRDTKLFCFDSVFGPEHTQEQMFSSVATSLINKVVEGYNGTIFAYGQTGSGKTHTMMGNVKSEELMGIIPRSFSHVLSLINKQPNKSFLMRCSFIEIYNEEIYDLLNANIKNRLEVKESEDKGVFVKELSKHIVRSLP